MKQKEIIRIGIIITICIVLLFSMKNCNDNKYHQLKGEYELLQKQYAAKKDSVRKIEDNRLKEKDSLSLIIQDREKKNQELIAKNISLEKKISQLQNKKISVPKDVPGLVNYFNERYDTKENEPVEDKVGLGQNTAYNVSYELEEKDSFSEIIDLKDQQLVNKDTIISNLEKDTKDLSMIILSAEEEIQQRKELQSMADDNIKNLEKQVKNLNRNKTLNKILIPVGIIGGGIIGYQIAK